MRKTLALFLALLLITIFTLTAFAATEESNIYNIGNVTVVFDEENPFDAATLEALAHMLASHNTDEDVATYNLICTLFGHNYETSGAITITHCAQSIQPRCLEEYFTVQVCSRCDNAIVERTGFCYITCCP